MEIKCDNQTFSTIQKYLRDQDLEYKTSIRESFDMNISFHINVEFTISFVLNLYLLIKLNLSAKGKTETNVVINNTTININVDNSDEELEKKAAEVIESKD